MRTPPLYNPARAEEMPLPNILPPAEINADELLIEQARSNQCLVVIEQNPNIVVAQSDDEEPYDNGIDGDNEALFEPLIHDGTENQEFELDPLALIKEEPLEPVHDDDIDEIANGIICFVEAENDIAEASNQTFNQADLVNNVREDSICADEAVNDIAGTSNQIFLGNNAQDENNDVRDEVVFEKLNEEVSISVGEMPLPFFVGLQLKSNDDFSGKMRFVEFASPIVPQTVEISND